MFVKSIAGTCFNVVSEKMLNNIKHLKGFEEITKEEYVKWCKENRYKVEEFVL